MKNQIKYYRISQGHIIASWNILFLLKSYNSLYPKDIVNFLTSSGKLGGQLPVKTAIKICLDYNLIRIEVGRLYLTDFSKNHIIHLCNCDDPNIAVLHAILQHIISFHNFQWLIFFDPDPEVFKSYLFEQDPEWLYLLENASLFNFENKTVNDWWDSVLSKYEKCKQEIKKAIGDIGEKLTYDYELIRIKEDGHTPSKSFVKWASQLSDQFGYDILSIRGKKFSFVAKERDKIQIEVKSSDINSSDAFRFYISKPEWRTALRNIESYFFYCWIGINLTKESASDGPFIIPAKDLVDQMPLDISPSAEWSECRCVLDISKYK